MFFILGSESYKIPFIIFLFLFTSFLEVIGIGLIAPYIAIIITPDVFYDSIFFTMYEYLSLNTNNKEIIKNISILLIFVFLLKSIVAISINKYILSFSTSQGARLSHYLMNAFQRMPYQKYIMRNSSEYLYSISNLAINYGFILQSFLKLTSECVVVIAIFTFLANENLLILLSLSTILLGAIFFYDRVFRKLLIDYGLLRNKAMQTQLKAINEGIEGLKEVRILGKEDFFHSTVKENALKYAKYWVTVNLIQTSPRYFLEILLVLFIVTVVLFNLSVLENIETLLPTLAMFGVASVRLLPTSNQIMTCLAQIRNGKDSIYLLYQDLITLSNTNIRVKENIKFKDEKFLTLEMKNVSYSYPNSNSLACKKVSLKINQGELIGIIGQSGAGKTTLVDIILGFLEPQEGKILYNGEDITKNMKKWSSRIAYLPQEIFTIDNSIKENITLSKEEGINDHHRLQDSISKSKLSELIKELPNGINTVLGERGIRLSGGQRQRIAIARSFYHQRDFLIFDEATSSLDQETEKNILDEIKQFKGDRTMIIITHRLSTIKICDRIYKLDSGQIIQEGSYHDVVNQSSR